MKINWDDNTKRKAFRIALEKAYPNEADLRIFVDEELNENLAEIAANSNLQVTAHALMQWAKAKGKLDVLFEAFCRENSTHPVIAKLRQKPLIKPSSKLEQGDLGFLFSLFSEDDSAYIQISFRSAFRFVYGRRFEEIRPDRPSLNTPVYVQELIADYDNPTLAVRFVESVIAEFQRTGEDDSRDLTVLQQWRDHIAQRYDVHSPYSEPALPTASYAYLLVVLEEMGSDVNVSPELRIPGKENPIEFGATPTTCAVSKVVDQISQWIKQAEETLEIRQCEEEVILELFLPCKYLDEDVAMTWKVKDKRNDEIALGNHRRFLVRSTERIRDRQIQSLLNRKWKKLEACVSAGDGCGQFHLQESCPEQKGDLCALLKDCNATGLKLIARLPSDSGKRTDLLNDIIDAAIPIALWSSEVTETDREGLKTEFDSLLRQCHLTNFADLARQWRRRRIESVPARQIKLLCDRPDRVPKIPDPTQEEDLLVAS